MSLDSVLTVAQLALNGGALVGGAVVWRLYVENLKATIGTKDAEISLQGKQVSLWRDRAQELEKRAPEAVEKVLAERIAIREEEIKKLADDRERNSTELLRVEQEVVVLKRYEEEVTELRRALEQTKGFREMLALDGDLAFDDQENAVVEIEVSFLGMVAVDSGQLMIADPCRIDSEWVYEPFQIAPTFRDVQNGATLSLLIKEPMNWDKVLDPYGETARKLVQQGRLVEVEPETPSVFNFSYDGACKATLSAGHGEMTFHTGNVGAGVAFSTAFGDGLYPIYGEKHNGRIMRVYVNVA